MRVLLGAAAVLVSGAGVPLFLLSTTTAEHFAWTIEPALTAATLGAAYWGSAVIEAQAARAKTWAEARVAVPGVLIFITVTCYNLVGDAVRDALDPKMKT